MRYGAPPVGNLRFSAPTKPTGQAFSDGSKAVTCFQVLPAWANYTEAWVENGTAAFNISAGYQPPNITELPPVDPESSEDCLFLDLMVPKVIFDNIGSGPGAPVYVDMTLSFSRCYFSLMSYFRMVWIHGGGYTYGSKRVYSPSAAGLLKASQSNGKDGVIWLAINYRLGIFVGSNLLSLSLCGVFPFEWGIMADIID